MFMQTICSEDLPFMLVRGVCIWELLLFKWLLSINHGWWSNTVDSWSKCPVSCSRVLKGVSQIMHECLSSWKQRSGECTFPSCLVPSPSRQGGIDALCMWSFNNVMRRQRCMEEVISFFHTKSDSAWANSLNSYWHTKLFALLGMRRI